jgi:flagellar hook-associated protein 2
MLDTINKDADANVTMQYSRLKDAFTITADSGGEDSSVNLANVTGNAFGENGAFKIAEGVYENGCNSIAVIDGVTVERSTNSYTIDGASYELTELTDVSDQYINFTIEKDYSAAADSVESFITALNTLVTKLNDYVNVNTNTYRENSTYLP